MKNKRIFMIPFIFLILQFFTYNCSIYVDLPDRERVSDERVPDERVPDERSPDERVPDERVPDVETNVVESTSKKSMFCKFYKLLSRALTTRPHIKDVAFHPKKNWLALASRSGILEVWDVENSSRIFGVNTQDDLAKEKRCYGCSQVVSISFDPSGKYLAFGTWSSSSLLYIWDLTKRTIIRKIPHVKEVRRIAFSSDGKMVGTASGSFAQVWEVETGRKIFTYKKKETKPPKVQFYSLVFSADDKFLFLGKTNGEIEYIEIKTGLPKKKFYQNENGSWVLFLRLVKEKNILIASSLYSIKIWNLKNFHVLRQMKGDFSFYTNFDLAPRKNLLVSTHSNRTILFWDISTGQIVDRIKETYSRLEWVRTSGVALSKDEKYVAFFTIYGPVELWTCSF